MTESLQKIYERYKVGDWPDKGSTHSFIEYYETLLAPYRHTAKNILEIGLMSGESLRMWTEYFAGTVYGMDCDVYPIGHTANLFPIMAEGKHNIVIGDAANPADIDKYFKGIKFDVVVEDAGHDVEQQLQIYATLKPYMAEGSIYIIEDIQDIDSSAVFFKVIGGQIIDRRKEKLRYDDVLVIIRQ